MKPSRRIGPPRIVLCVLVLGVAAGVEIAWSVTYSIAEHFFSFGEWIATLVVAFSMFSFVAPRRAVRWSARIRALVWLRWHGHEVVVAAARAWAVRASRRITAGTAMGLVGLAVGIAGARRAFRRREWLGDLDGAAREARPGWRQLGLGVGFVVCAVRWRVRDAAVALGRKLDWVLACPRTEYLGAAAGVVSALYFARSGGVGGLLENLDNVVAAGLVIEMPGSFLRVLRQVPPARRNPAREDAADPDARSSDDRRA